MKIVVYDDSVVDSHGTRILVEGIKLDRFAKNPIVQVQHDNEILPVGKALTMSVEGSKLVMEIEFDAADSLAQDIKRKLENGYLNAFSIGGMPLAWSEEETYRLSAKQWVTFTAFELWEVSVVNVPSNPNAVVQRSALPSQFHITTIPNSNKMIEEKNIIGEVLKRMALPEDVEAAIREVDGLRTQVLQLKQQIHDREVAQLLDTAIAERKMLSAEREAMKELAETNIEVVRRLLAARQAYEPVAPKVGRAAEMQDDRKDWTFMDWQKRDPKGLGEMRQNQPDKYNELFKQIATKNSK